MRKFIINIIIYLFIPLVLFFIVIESILTLHPNSFLLKAKYLKENKNKIENLFIGSSHTETGINPFYIDNNTINLGYSRQDYQIDSAIISTHIDHMNNLKYVFHEMDYLDFYKEMDSTYFRYSWYDRYYDIKLGSYPKYHKWSLYLSNPDFFNQYLTNGIWTKNKLNKYGFVDSEPKLRFYKNNYDSIKVFNDDYSDIVVYKLNKSNLKRYDANLARLEFLRKLCEENGVAYINVVYPIHKTYRDKVKDSETYKLWRRYIKKQTENGKTVWDFEKDDRFFIRDYSNPSHLNNTGAKKLSKIINDSINHYIKSKRN